MKLLKAINHYGRNSSVNEVFILQYVIISNEQYQISRSWNTNMFN